MNRLKLNQPEHADEKGIVMSDLKKKFAALTRKKNRYPNRLHVANVRCNRNTREWLFTRPDGFLAAVEEMLITRGSFACQLNSGGSGCGGYSYYSGEASGHIQITDKELELLKYDGRSKQLGPIPKSHEGSRRLGFDSDTGKFFDAETLEPIETFKKLLLLPGCKAIYWP